MSSQTFPNPVSSGTRDPRPMADSVVELAAKSVIPVGLVVFAALALTVWVTDTGEPFTLDLDELPA